MVEILFIQRHFSCSFVSSEYTQFVTLSQATAVNVTHIIRKLFSIFLFDPTQPQLEAKSKPIPTKLGRGVYVIGVSYPPHTTHPSNHPPTYF